ncbi:MAG: TlpA family protein disulfide reductase [Candidatus Zixiibacteriota bacterium]
MKIKLVPFITGVIILVLVIFNLLLLQKDRALRNNFNQLSQRVELFSSFSPLLTAGDQPFCFTFLNPETKEPYQPKLVLLIFFSTNDCVTCLQEASLWEELQKNFYPKGLKVLGMVPSTDSLQMKKFAEAESLSFPIIYVDSIYIKQHIGIPQTPFKVLLDSTLTVVYLNGPNSDVEDQLRFKNVIEKWCSLPL